MSNQPKDTRLTAMQQEITCLRQELAEWEEKEASVCPEDFGFVEYIGVLRKQLAEALGNLGGHNALCYYCAQPCNALHGNLSLGPIPLCHADEPGVVKWHHIGCVSERLAQLADAQAHKEASYKNWQEALRERDLARARLLCEHLAFYKCETAHVECLGCRICEQLLVAHEKGFEEAHELRNCGHSVGDFRDPKFGTPKYKGEEECVGCFSEKAAFLRGQFALERELLIEKDNPGQPLLDRLRRTEAVAEYVLRHNDILQNSPGHFSDLTTLARQALAAKEEPHA